MTTPISSINPKLVALKDVSPTESAPPPIAKTQTVAPDAFQTTDRPGTSFDQFQTGKTTAAKTKTADGTGPTEAEAWERAQQIAKGQIPANANNVAALLPKLSEKHRDEFIKDLAKGPNAAALFGSAQSSNDDLKTISKAVDHAYRGMSSADQKKFVDELTAEAKKLDKEGAFGGGGRAALGLAAVIGMDPNNANKGGIAGPLATSLKAAGEKDAWAVLATSSKYQIDHLSEGDRYQAFQQLNHAYETLSHSPGTANMRTAYDDVLHNQARLFEQDTSNIMQRTLNGDVNDKIALKDFLQHDLFGAAANKLGYAAGVKKALDGFDKNLVAKINDPKTSAEARDLYTKQAGTIAGLAAKAAVDALADSQADKASRDRLVNDLVSVATNLIPGVGGAISNGLSNEIADMINGALDGKTPGDPATNVFNAFDHAFKSGLKGSATRRDDLDLTFQGAGMAVFSFLATA